MNEKIEKENGLMLFEYSVRQAYSNYYDWRKPAGGGFEPISWAEAEEKNNQACEYSGYYNTWVFPIEKPGVYSVFENDHGGNYEEWGYIAAPSNEEAKKIFREYLDAFPVYSMDDDE